MNKSIEVEGLRKSYGEVKAVRGASFYVEEGQLFALLGENGAGKTTTIDILSTLLAPDGGKVQIAGFTLGRQNNDIRRRIGIVFQKSYLDDMLTVRENLTVRGSFYSASRAEVQQSIARLAGPLGIEEFLDRRYGKLSGGQRRRADIARALINTPDILFLDEPTTGLDPASRKAIWETVRTLQRESGTTVLLTTHYMEEAAAADYVIVMGHGRILDKGTPPALKERHATDMLRAVPKDMTALQRAFEKAGRMASRNGAVLEVPLATTTDALPLLQQWGSEFETFEVVQGNMDEAFLSIIKTGEEVGA